MEQNKVKILVACHKPDTVYQDDVYTPIHVGRAISKNKEEMAEMLGDDTGDNISVKNPYYCELTAQYWGWKNIHTEYIGLCHYRRYFEEKITSENIDAKLGSNSDILCVTPIHEKYRNSLRLVRASCLEDYQIFMYSLKKVSPSYYLTAKEFLSKGVVTPYNMFVMKKSLFDRFAEWQFSILFEMEKHLRLSPYTRAKRVFGYYAEMMLPIFIKKNGLKVVYSNCVSMIGEKTKKHPFAPIYNFYIDMICKNGKCYKEQDVDAVITGFKLDGIDVGYLEK